MRRIAQGILFSAIALTATAQDLLTDLSNIGSFILANGNPYSSSWNLYNGIVLGLQQNTENTEHSCYTSFQGFSAALDTVPSFVLALANPPTTASQNSIIYQMNLEWYMMPSTYFILIKRFSEIGSIYFSFYK